MAFNDLTGTIPTEIGNLQALEKLDLYFNEHISAEGWVDFLAALNGCEDSALEEISLSENNIDDEIADLLADAFASMTLRILRLDDNKFP